MYAVIQTGGKQYRVRPGDVIVVEKLDGDVGSEVAFDNVLMVGGGDKGVSLGSALKGALVRATLIETRKGEKMKVFKKIRRQGYRRTQGHRQFESVLRITGLEGGGETAKWDGEVDLTPRSVLVARARGLAPAAEASPAEQAAEVFAKAPAKAATSKAAAPKTATVKAGTISAGTHIEPSLTELEAPVEEAAMMDTPVSEQVAETPAKAAPKAKAPKAETAPAAENAPAKAKAESKPKAPAAETKAEPKAEAAPKKAAAPKAAKADETEPKAQAGAKAPAKAKPAPKAGK